MDKTEKKQLDQELQSLIGKSVPDFNLPNLTVNSIEPTSEIKVVANDQILIEFENFYRDKNWTTLQSQTASFLEKKDDPTVKLYWIEANWNLSAMPKEVLAAALENLARSEQPPQTDILLRSLINIASRLGGEKALPLFELAYRLAPFHSHSEFKNYLNNEYRRLEAESQKKPEHDPIFGRLHYLKSYIEKLCPHLLHKHENNKGRNLLIYIVPAVVLALLSVFAGVYFGTDLFKEIEKPLPLAESLTDKNQVALNVPVVKTKIVEEVPVKIESEPQESPSAAPALEQVLDTIDNQINTNPVVDIPKPVEVVALKTVDLTGPIEPQDLKDILDGRGIKEDDRRDPNQGYGADRPKFNDQQRPENIVRGDSMLDPIVPGEKIAGREYSPVNNFSAGSILRILRDCSLYVAPDEDEGEIIALPQGGILTVLRVDGDWIRVETPRGRLGYVKKEDVYPDR